MAKCTNGQSGRTKWQFECTNGQFGHFQKVDFGLKKVPIEMFLQRFCQPLLENGLGRFEDELAGLTDELADANRMNLLTFSCYLRNGLMKLGNQKTNT